MPRLRVLAMLAALAVLGAACDDDGNDSEVSMENLDGRTFVAGEIEGFTLVEGTELTLTFAADSVVANAGCNTMQGQYEIVDDVLTIEGAMAATLMACPDDLQAQDTWVSDFLSGGPTVTLAGDTLTLTADDATVTATELT
jgi:heat shock protein HslJ